MKEREEGEEKGEDLTGYLCMLGYRPLPRVKRIPAANCTGRLANRTGGLDATKTTGAVCDVARNEETGVADQPGKRQSACYEQRVPPVEREAGMSEESLSTRTTS